VANIHIIIPAVLYKAHSLLAFFRRTSSTYSLVRVDGYCFISWHTWNIHTHQNSPGRVIGPSQRPLPTQQTKDTHPRPQEVSNPRTQQSSGRRPTPQTARPPESAPPRNVMVSIRTITLVLYEVINLLPQRIQISQAPNTVPTRTFTNGINHTYAHARAVYVAKRFSSKLSHFELYGICGFQGH
jgi:hypothetical protein